MTALIALLRSKRTWIGLIMTMLGLALIVAPSAHAQPATPPAQPGAVLEAYPAVGSYALSGHPFMSGQFAVGVSDTQATGPITATITGDVAFLVTDPTDGLAKVNEYEMLWSLQPITGTTVMEIGQLLIVDPLNSNLTVTFTASDPADNFLVAIQNMATPAASPTTNSTGATLAAGTSPTSAATAVTTGNTGAPNTPGNEADDTGQWLDNGSSASAPAKQPILNQSNTINGTHIGIGGALIFLAIAGYNLRQRALRRRR